MKLHLLRLTGVAAAVFEQFLPLESCSPPTPSSAQVPVYFAMDDTVLYSDLEIQTISKLLMFCDPAKMVTKDKKTTTYPPSIIDGSVCVFLVLALHLTTMYTDC